VIACKELRVKLVPVGGPEMTSANKDRVPGRLKGKIFCAPNAFDPLTGRELSDLGFDQATPMPFDAKKLPTAANPKPFYGLR